MGKLFINFVIIFSFQLVSSVIVCNAQNTTQPSNSIKASILSKTTSTKTNLLNSNEINEIKFQSLKTQQENDYKALHHLINAASERVTDINFNINFFSVLITILVLVISFWTQNNATDKAEAEARRIVDEWLVGHQAVLDSEKRKINADFELNKDQSIKEFNEYIEKLKKEFKISIDLHEKDLNEMKEKIAKDLLSSNSTRTDESKKTTEKIEDKRLADLTYYDWRDLAFKAYDDKNFALAVEYLEKSKKVANITEVQIANSVYTQALMSSNPAKYAEAIAYFKETIEMLKKHNTTDAITKIASSLHYIGVTYRLLNNEQESNTYLGKVISEYGSSSIPEVIKIVEKTKSFIARYPFTDGKDV